MKRACLALAASLAIVTAAHATSNWKGEGWYQVVDHSRLGSSMFKLIYLGPYTTKASCLKVLHPDYVDPGAEAGDPEELNHFSCVQLKVRPDWDN